MNFSDTATYNGASEKLWPQLFYVHSPTSAITRLCLECRKTEVKARQRFCGKCAAARKRASTRNSLRNSRSNVRKVANSPIGAEALTLD